MSDNRLKEDRFGNPYVEMNPAIRGALPDVITLTFRGEDKAFYLDPRIYLPRDGDDIIANTALGIRYVTAEFMAENLEELTEEE